jgi:hypothetical protein
MHLPSVRLMVLSPRGADAFSLSLCGAGVLGLEFVAAASR